MARLISLEVDASMLQGALSKSTRRFVCHHAPDVGAILASGAAAPDLVVLGGDAKRAADAAEALTDDAALLVSTLLGWRLQGSRTDTARLIALGVRITSDDEGSFRRACEEALDARAGRTVRVNPPTEVRAGHPQVLDLHGRRVLVADDDPAMTWYVADLLRSEGCDVWEAGDGASALAIARASLPDLVISDIRMPGTNGVRLCQFLRRDPVLGDVPILLLSWKGDWLRDAERAGAEATAYLEKRSTPEEFLAAAREALSAHMRLEQRLRQATTLRGQLEGTTPYRLLRLACTLRSDARLIMRCSPYAYEVHIRDGAPRSATRFSPGGDAVRGAVAIASLLDERSGRFVLGPQHGGVEANLTGSLQQQVLPQVTRFRQRNVVAVDDPKPTDLVAVATQAADSTQADLASELPSIEDPVDDDAPGPTVLPISPHIGDRTAVRRSLSRAGRSAPPSRVEAPGARRRSAPALRWVALAALALGVVLGAGAHGVHRSDAANARAETAR
jgi:CheY-like chemotaxis protein